MLAPACYYRCAGCHSLLPWQYVGKPAERFFCVLVGPPNVGKTRFLLDLCNRGPRLSILGSSISACAFPFLEPETIDFVADRTVGQHRSSMPYALFGATILYESAYHTQTLNLAGIDYRGESTNIANMGPIIRLSKSRGTHLWLIFVAGLAYHGPLEGNGPSFSAYQNSVRAFTNLLAQTRRSGLPTKPCLVWTRLDEGLVGFRLNLPGIRRLLEQYGASASSPFISLLPELSTTRPRVKLTDLEELSAFLAERAESIASSLTLGKDLDWYCGLLFSMMVAYCIAAHTNARPALDFYAEGGRNVVRNLRIFAAHLVRKWAIGKNLFGLIEEINRIIIDNPHNHGSFLSESLITIRSQRTKSIAGATSS